MALASLVVEIQANTAALHKGLKDATNSVKSFQRDMNYAANAAKVFTAGLGVQQIAHFVLGNIKSAAALKDVAEQIGISTQALQEFQFAAAQSGIGSEEMSAAVGKLSRKIGEAANGSGDAIKTFREMGVGILTAGGQVRETSAVLSDIAERVKNAATPAEQARIAFEAFGRTGQKLIPMLSGGAAGLTDFARAARETGTVLSRDMIEQAKVADDKMEALNLTATRLAQTLAIGLAPMAINLADMLRKMAGGATDAERRLALEQRIANLQSTPGAAARLSGGRFKELQDALDARRRIAEEEARTARATDSASDTGPVNTRLPDSKESIEYIKNLRAEAMALKAVGDEEKFAAEMAKIKIALSAEQRVEVEQSIRDKLKAAAAERSYAIELRASMEEGKRDDTAREASNNSARSQIMARYAHSVALERERTQNDQLLDSLRISEEAYENVRARIEAVNDARSAGVSISEDEARVLADRVSEQRIEMQRLREEYDFARETGRDVFNVIGTAAEDAMVRFTSLREVLAGLAQDMLRILYRVAITKPLENALLGTAGGGGGLLAGLSSLFGGAGEGSVNASGGHAARFAGEFAEGGTIPAGQWGVVGERGPEIISGPASITPNLGGGEVNVVINFSAGVRPDVQAEVQRLMPVISAGVRRAVADANQRGGSYARALS